MVRGPKAASGALRWLCRNGRTEGRGYCYSSTDPSAGLRRQDGSLVKTSRTKRSPRFKRKLAEGTKVFVITCAQNATPVEPDFWSILRVIEADRGAELVVIPIRYKNPTSLWTASQANAETWVTEVQPFLWNVNKSLNDSLVLIGKPKTQPTAGEPLSGFDAITGIRSGIIGHPKVALTSIATPSGSMAKIMVTTGACTKANYTDSKAGAKGEFHHSLAAIIVELGPGKSFHLRHVWYDARTRSVTDLDRRYTANGVEQAPRPLALIMGDTHVDFIDPLVEQATFGPDGIIRTLRPRHAVYHDLLDAYSCNPHHRGNPFIAYAKAMSGRGDVRAEVQRACEFVRQRTTGDMVSVIVPSNHDDMLTRWIIAEDWKTTGGNMKFYLDTAHRMLTETRMTDHGAEYPPALPLVFSDFVDTTNIRPLKIDEPFVLANVDLGMHGDRGPNGSRGSIKNIRRIGVRSIIGHSHSPGISEGCVQVGTSTRLRLEYNRGPGAWLNAHCLLHEDGKRQLLFIINGQWRGRTRTRKVSTKRYRRAA